MWERVRRLCHGTEIGKQDMDNKLLTEFEKPMNLTIIGFAL